MKLSEKQRRFSKACVLLETFALVIGYELTDGDAYRDPRVHGKPGEKGSYSGRYSNHKYRLARDYNLFISGEYQKTSKAYKPLGDFWIALGPHVGLELEWGGSDGRPDGNHFSARHNGRW